MKKIMLVAIALGIVMSSCSKTDTEPSAGGQNEVVVNFSLGGATKANSGINETAVNTAYVFAFDGNRLDGSTYVTGNTGTIKVTSGSRRFIAVVNPNSEFSFTSVTTPASVMNLVSQLGSEALSDMVMIGDQTQTVTESTSNVTIAVTRLVSKISVNSLKFQFTGALAGKTASNVEIYLKNYPVSQTYSGTSGTSYASGLFSGNRSAFEVYDLVGTMTDGLADASGHHFYCYHRETSAAVSGSGAIRLCVRAIVDGQTYYWSLPVNNGDVWTATAFASGDSHFGVKRNHSYEYDITITRAGIPDDGLDPDPEDPDDLGDDDLEDDEDLTTSDLSFTLRVNDFIEVAEQNVTF
mgnify:FL=1